MAEKAFRQAVGELAQQAALLESVVGIVAWGMAGLDHRIAKVVVPNNMERMLSLIKDLLPLRVSDQELRAEVESWIGDVRTAYAQRSRVLHSTWVGDGDEGEHFRTDLRPRKPGKDVDVAHASDIAELAEVLRLLYEGDRMSFIGPLAAHVGGPWMVATSAELEDKNSRFNR